MIRTRIINLEVHQHLVELVQNWLYIYSHPTYVHQQVSYNILNKLTASELLLRVVSNKIY